MRLIGSVVAGYLVIAVTVFAGLSAAYAALGPDRAFQPGVYDVSVLWIVTSIVVGFAAAVLGGWLTGRIARSVTGPRALAVVVVVLGVAFALPIALGEPAVGGARDAAVGVFDVMRLAETPLWVALLNPLIGAVGVLLGGRLTTTAREEDAAQRP